MLLPDLGRRGNLSGSGLAQIWFNLTVDLKPSTGNHSPQEQPRVRFEALQEQLTALLSDTVVVESDSLPIRVFRSPISKLFFSIQKDPTQHLKTLIALLNAQT